LFTREHIDPIAKLVKLGQRGAVSGQQALVLLVTEQTFILLQRLIDLAVVGGDLLFKPGHHGRVGRGDVLPELGAGGSHRREGLIQREDAGHHVSLA
jgi:hypothetical protein